MLVRPYKLSDEPPRIKDRTEHALPIVTKSNRETELPSCASPKTLILDPSLEKVRKLILLPNKKLSTAEIEDPSLAVPYKEYALPILAIDLKLREEPMDR
jgi:hypothetical protein